MDAFIERVFAYLQDEWDLMNAALACKAWYSVLKDDSTWRKMYFTRYEGIIQLTEPKSWKCLYMTKLGIGTIIQETWKHVLSFKIGANMGRVLAFKRDKGAVVLVTDNGVIKGRVEKGKLTKTMHYFDTTSGPVGAISCAIFLGDRLLISGPSGVGVLYEKGCEEYSDERMYDVVFRGLTGVDTILYSEEKCVLVVSKAGDCTKIFKVDLRHKQSALLISLSDVSAYAAYNNCFLHANKKGEVFLSEYDKQEMIASLDTKIEKIEKRGKFLLAYSEAECFAISESIHRLHWKKHLLNVAFDQNNVPFAVQTKGPAVSMPIFKGEYSLVLREGKMFVLDGSTGEVLNNRVLHGPRELTILEESESVLIFTHGRTLIFWGNDANLFQAHPPITEQRRVRNKKSGVRLVMNQQIEEVEQEEWEEDRLEILRERMNIDGLTEEEMVQYALLLSSIDDP